MQPASLTALQADALEDEQTPSPEHEALMQFLYQAPIGLVRTTLDGDILMLNPMSAQLLVPLATGGMLINLFDALQSVAPQLRELAGRPAASGTVVYEAMHTLTLAPIQTTDRRASARPQQVLSVRVLRLDATLLMCTLHDVTLFVQQEQQREASRLQDALRMDGLTTLPNRAVALEHIARVLHNQSRGRRRPFGVLFINVDRFHRINVTLGQAAGDELIRRMAARLKASLRQGDVVTASRLGADEFVVVLEVHHAVDEALTVAQRLTLQLCTPAYTINGLQLHVSVSVGVLTSADATSDAEAVLQDASLAMREAKRAGGSRFCMFEPGMRQRVAQRGLLERELRTALAENQLFVAYQPIVDLSNGEATGVEALVRWQHPNRGAVSPLEFIPIAEETGLIGALGEMVLNTACRQLVTWQRAFGAQAPRVMSVNLSRAQLLDGAVCAKVRRALSRSGLPAACLQLEVTESLAVQDEQIQARLLELKALGLTLALDDFGTGYSSLASLHQLPIDVIKIDRSFVSQVTTSLHHRVLIEAIVQVAQSLGLGTVAEGIETEAQAAILTTLRCQKGQGFLYSKALPQDPATRSLTACVRTCEVCRALRRRCACRPGG